MTTKILVLYYSMYGHVETLARAISQGAGDVDGVGMEVKRIPETIPDAVARGAGAKLDQEAPRPRWTSWWTTTASSSARPHVSATCAARCVIFSTRPGSSGSRAA